MIEDIIMEQNHVLYTVKSQVQSSYKMTSRIISKSVWYDSGYHFCMNFILTILQCSFNFC